MGQLVLPVDVFVHADDVTVGVAKAAAEMPVFIARIGAPVVIGHRSAAAVGVGHLGLAAERVVDHARVAYAGHRRCVGSDKGVEMGH